ncbi:hypothetical protein EZV62_006745 [Acer yangbiense]|uniref:Protein kinase domain-containing protein n=1 Tax=Acer yangbiense TaxID=1000413 RepID=A0A5C7I801_9ROSI|nr:hypothetical protein EZV62_006745 [Acer yangbiense]
MSDFIRNDDRSPYLEWKLRLKIAMEIANAVAYLHVGFTRPIVSKSRKLAHFLFDEECVAKQFDFTLSEVISIGETHVNNRVVRATMGHVAPEYAHTGDFNEKSDVFSFHILLLQLLTGHELREDVEKYIENNRFDEIIDPMIVGNGLCPEKEHQLKVFADLALKCVTESAEDQRPTMEPIEDLFNHFRFLLASQFSGTAIDVQSIPEGETHIKGWVAGTMGLIAPDYMHTGLCNEQNDVYSFGVLLLVLLTGQKIYNPSRRETGGDYWLLLHVKKCNENNRFIEMIDPVIVRQVLCARKVQQLQAFYKSCP